jgi:two-component system, NarL family, response regulator DevR
VVDGQTNREIAVQMRLAEKTIRNYVSNILGKVGLRNRTQLAVYVAHLLDER